MYLYIRGTEHEHALEDLAEIPQVEGVVSLCGSGQQLLQDGVEDSHCC